MSIVKPQYTIALVLCYLLLTACLKVTQTVPTAAFTSQNNCQGKIPCEVSFTSSSTGHKSVQWKFGDDTYSIDESPKHTYTGSSFYYVVTLNAVGKDDESTAVDTVFIAAHPGCSQKGIYECTRELTETEPVVGIVTASEISEYYFFNVKQPRQVVLLLQPVPAGGTMECGVSQLLVTAGSQEKEIQPPNKLENKTVIVVTQSTESKKPEPRIKRPRRHSSFRCSLALEGGGLMTIPGSFSNQELLDYATYNWKDSGGLTQRYGYSAGISVHRSVTAWLSTGIGYQHLYIPFAEKQLQLQIKNYLSNKRVSYKGVGVSSNAYRLHVFYASLGVGNYWRDKTVYSIEPVIGRVNSNILFTNKLSVHIRYASGAEQHQELLLRYPPFWVYGGRFTLQKKLGEESKLRIQATGYYMFGKSEMASQQIDFSTIHGTIILPAPRLEVIGVNLGLHYTLR